MLPGGMYPSVEPGGHDGPGSLVVIPSVVGCGCDDHCLLLDEFRFHSACVCLDNGVLKEDGYSCTGTHSALCIHGQLNKTP